MAFQKGQPKPINSGRQKGTPNKKRLRKVSEVLAEMEIEPVVNIMNLLQSGDLKPVDELNGWFDLLSYCEAKPKEANEDTAKDEISLIEAFNEVSDEALLKLVKPEGNA